MFDYAFVAVGYTRVIKASDKWSAVAQAQKVAADIAARAWLLYDRVGNLIYSRGASIT